MSVCLVQLGGRTDHVGHGVNVTGQLGLPIEGVIGRAATTYTQFKANLTRYVAYRPSILHWIMTTLQLKTLASLAAHALMAIPSNMYPNGFGPFA
jgi:hypothetical protein